MTSKFYVKCIAINWNITFSHNTILLLYIYITSGSIIINETCLEGKKMKEKEKGNRTRFSIGSELVWGRDGLGPS